MWLEFHDSARDHPKILKVAKDLGIEEAHALGHVAALWAWTLTMAPDGELSSFDYDDIEIGAKWKGEAGAFVRAAINRKLLDKIDGDAANLKCHDWEDYAQHLKAAQRKREERARKREKSQDVTGRHRTSQDAEEVSQDVTPGEGGVTGTDRPTDQTDQTDPPSRARDEVVLVNPDQELITKEEYNRRHPAPITDVVFKATFQEPGNGQESHWFEKPFSERFEAAMGALWQRGGQYWQTFKDLERYCRDQGKHENTAPECVRDVIIDNFYQDEYAQKVSYSPSLIAKNPARFYRPPTSEPVVEDEKAEYVRKLAEARKRLAHLEGNGGPAADVQKAKDRITSLSAMLRAVEKEREDLSC